MPTNPTTFLGPEPETYQIIRLPESGWRNAQMPKNLPCAHRFIESIQALSAFGPDRAIRPYLLEIVKRGYFEIVSPKSGRRLRSGSSIILNDLAVFFSFPDEPDLLVGAGGLDSGFGLSAVIELSSRLMLCVSDSIWAIRQKHLGELEQSIRISGWTIGSATERPQVVIGADGNFAHNAWNQLSALRVALTISDTFDVVCTHEPFGRIDNLFSNLSPDRITRTPASWLNRLNAPGKLLVPVGSTFLSRATRDVILENARREIAHEAKAILEILGEKPGPVLWVSVRTRNRTADNQTEALTALCRKYLALDPANVVILDGHSLPSDFVSNCESHDTGGVQAIVQSDRAVAEQIAAACGEKGRVHVAVGLPISSSIVLAQRASFYFCHHGTVQHKIGWFTSCDGVVHCNRSTLVILPAIWVSEQSEIARVPVYIPPDFVTDYAAKTGDEQTSSLRHENYTFNDIDKLVDFVLKVRKEKLKS